MKKWILLLLLLIPNRGYSQQFNLQYNYTEICSEQIRQVSIPIDLKRNNTLAFFGYSRDFTPLEIQNNEHIIWLNDIYQKWREYYPCAEIKGLVTDAAKSASESGDIDISQPIVIMASDFGYKNGGVFNTTAGYNKANLLTNISEGMLLAMGTDFIGNIGYFRIAPINDKATSLININVLLLQTSVIGNTTFGTLGDLGGLGSYFALHTMTFGKLNGYPFQDNTVMFGHSKRLLNTKKIVLSTNLILSYTYRVRVFTLDYWFEDYIGIKPFVNVGYKLSPTFGLNVTYTTSLRTDKNTSDRYAILLGGRVLF